jgi:predicted metal-dependent phosphoesterase TrpH
MFIDLHAHERLFSSCSRMALEDAVRAAKNHGLDGLCITDHDSMDIREVAAAYLCSEEFPVFIGVEYSTLQGDMIAFGLDAPPVGPPLEAQEFLDQVNRRNAFCFAAHPFRYGGWGGLGGHLYSLSGLHGIEVYNGGNRDKDNQKAVRACRELGLVALAGSDAHAVEAVGSYATWFPERITTEQELIHALKAGAGRPAIREGKGRYRFL